jgi:hypothetical protein
MVCFAVFFVNVCSAMGAFLGSHYHNLSRVESGYSSDFGRRVSFFFVLSFHSFILGLFQMPPVKTILIIVVVFLLGGMFGGGIASMVKSKVSSVV